MKAQRRLAEAYLRRAFTAVDGTDDPSARGWVLQAAALYGIGLGRWPEVRRHLEAVSYTHLTLPTICSV